MGLVVSAEDALIHELEMDEEQEIDEESELSEEEYDTEDSEGLQTEIITETGFKVFVSFCTN